MQTKGQGSLEYLLIIGGGILVAVIIIGAIVTLANTGNTGNRLTLAETQCNGYQLVAQCQAATATQISGIRLTGNANDPTCPTGGYAGETDEATTRGLCCWKASVGSPPVPAANKQCVLATNAEVAPQ